MRKASDDPVFMQVLEGLGEAHMIARKGKTKTCDEARFEMNLAENLRQLALDICSRAYEPSAGIAFIETGSSGVSREIYAAPYRDRVVHHFICMYVMDWWDRHLIYDSASCRKGKGTLFAVERLDHHIRSVSRNYREPTCVYKGDLQGFFMSLPRHKLYERAHWGLERQFPGEKPPIYYVLDFLWKKVLMQNPVKTARYRGKPSDWDVLPPSKILACQPPGRGIVIGNLTSQLASNFYLDLLDRFITLDLGYKHYSRYVDDFCIVFPSEQLPQFQKDLAAVQRFIEDVLLLKLHPHKSHLYKNMRQGVPYLGKVVYPHHIVPSRRMKANMRKTVFRHLEGTAGETEIWAQEGGLMHYRSRKMVDDIYEEFGLDTEHQLLKQERWRKK